MGDSIVPYILIAVILGVIVATLMYFRVLPGL
jgi:hypothetical protein